MASAALLAAGFVGVGVAERQHHRAPPEPASAVAAVPAGASLTAASTPQGGPAPGKDSPVAGLVDEGALAGADADALTDVAGALAGGVPSVSAPDPQTVAAIARGDVRVDVGPTAAGLDLRNGSQACPSFRVLGVQVGCQGATTPVVQPGDPGAAPDAGAGDDLGAYGAAVVAGAPVPIRDY